MSKHSIRSFSAALLKIPFYRALVNIFLFFKSPAVVLIRYIFEIGSYPKEFFIRTPLGLQCITAFSHHDLITIVECFGKLDYKAKKDISLVVDFGSNIGVSALYFLTRNKSIKVYLFEPVPKNIERLKINLKGFENRYELKEFAVGVEKGKYDFACDQTGRYGGLVKGGASYFSKWDSENIISVQVVLANEVLKEILRQHAFVDILKIDVEGYENKILSHLEKEVLSNIKLIYAETDNEKKITGFSSSSNSGLTRYRNISS